jgi:hypothetical protein
LIGEGGVKSMELFDITHASERVKYIQHEKTEKTVTYDSWYNYLTQHHLPERDSADDAGLTRTFIISDKQSFVLSKL